ncbi:MAG: PQQ-like beta-propeller repeat protein [Planctomycetaceae bacterium]|nr:PQQ-like beta-propeller repeat protein [Planctomycetaceae bacterium]
MLRTLSGLLLSAGLLGSVGLPQAVARDRDIRNRVHGPADFLKESLPQSSEFTRLLAAAERELQRGTGDAAFPALLEVFAQKYDQFTVIHADQPSASTYQLALQMLQRADFGTQQAWRQTVEPLAARALRDSRQDSAELSLIARRYPLTPSGRLAGALAARIAESRGEQSLAAALRRQNPTDRAVLDVADVNVIAGRADARPAYLAAPLPKNLWEWTVPFWQTPNATPFAPMAQDFHRSGLSLNSWTPVLTEDTLFCRTPFHVMAFDKLTGQVKWSLRTDTFEPPGSRLVPADDAPQLLDEGGLLRNDTLGSLAVHGRYLFFIDRFRLLTSPASFQFGNRVGARAGVVSQSPLRRAQGQRLVAVELSTPPRIAWTAGGTSFPYQVTANGLDLQPSEPLETTADPTAPPQTDVSQTDVSQTDRFCGVPVCVGRILFAVSHDGSAYWLNCLSQTTGKVRWRRPLLNQATNSERVRGNFLSTVDADTGASLCGVSGDVVVCALDNGVVLGASIADGRLLWATNLRRQIELQRNGRLQSMLTAAMRAVPGIRSRPLIKNGRLFWASPFSENVSCVDTQSGRILWESPRRSVHPGRLEGSKDSYVLDVTQSAVVVVGERHLRALDVSSGNELWATPVGQQTGRAFASQTVAIVPQVSGQLLQIDLETGKRSLLAEALGTGGPTRTGSVVADEQAMAFVTPVSVSVAPTFRTPSSFVASGQPAATESSGAVRSRLLRGETREALMQLSQSSVAADQKLLRDSLFAIAMQNEADADPDAVDALNWLGRLPLTPEESVRRALLTPGLIRFSREQIFARPSLVELAPDWRVRWDVAMLSREMSSSLQPPSPDGLMQATRAGEQREWAILQPSRIGDLPAQLNWARQLVQEHRYAAAELFLLSALSDAQADHKEPLKNAVRALRQKFSGPPQPRLASAPSRVEIEETLRLYTGSGVRGVRDQLRTRVPAPSWYPHRLYLTSRSLIGVDMNLGVESTRLSFPMTPEAGDRLDAFDTPSLVPLHGENRVGAVSLLGPDGPRVLWWKTIERLPRETAPIELGPFGSRFFTVTIGGRFLCLHPLTGDVLWERQTTDDVVNPMLMRRVSRLAGGVQTIARYGREMKSYELFRTLDGAAVATRRVGISTGQVPLQDAETLMFRQDKSLVLHHMPDGRNLLENSKAVRLAGAGQAQRLGDHRVVTLNDQLEIVVVSTETGQVQVRCPVGSLVSLDRVVGLRAFERDGLLMVLLKDWNHASSGRSASSRMGELRLDSGLLLAIEPEIGNIRWHQKISACVAPEIHGPESGLFVTWAWRNPEQYLNQQLWQQNRLGGLQNPTRSLTVTVYSMETGRELAAATSLSPAEPLRCVHDPQLREVLLESESAEVRLKYQ